MKHNFLVLMMFFSFILVGCQEKTTSKSKTTNALTCEGQSYWTTPGCTGYCQYQPSAVGCVAGGTTGTTTGGTTVPGGTPPGGVACTSPVTPQCSNYCTVYPAAYGCLANGTNCNLTPTAAGCPGSSTVVNPNWGVHYPGGEPTGSCSETYVPNGMSSAFDTRKGTITGTGLTTGSIEYNPLNASNWLNTSPMLKSVSQAKVFFMTDSTLKVRVKVKAQPAAAQTTTMCYNRNMPGVTIPGYTKLQYYVKVYGVNGSALSYLSTIGPFTTGVNSCSEAIDLSSYKEVSPGGVVIAIDQVKANQNCSSYSTSYGWSNCSSYRNVRSFDCWAMDFEVAADGTKTFD